MADKTTPQQQIAINEVAAQVREQLSTPEGTAEIVASLTLGHLVQLAGLDELADRDELLGWLMSTASAIRENPELRDQMRFQGEQLAADATSLLTQAADNA